MNVLESKQCLVKNKKYVWFHQTRLLLFLHNSTGRLKTMQTGALAHQLGDEPQMNLVNECSMTAQNVLMGRESHSLYFQSDFRQIRIDMVQIEHFDGAVALVVGPCSVHRSERANSNFASQLVLLRRCRPFIRQSFVGCRHGLSVAMLFR